MSLVIEELLSFDCLNFNDFFRTQPLLGNQWMEFHEPYTKYRRPRYGYAFEVSSMCHQLQA